MLDKIDNFTIVMFHCVTKVFVSVTGKSNIDLSLLLFRLTRMSMVYCIAYAILQSVMGNLLALFFVYWSYTFLRQIDRATEEIKGLRNNDGDNEAILPSFAKQMKYKGVGFWFLVGFVVYVFMDSGFVLVPAPLTFVLWFAAEYVALDSQGGGKSVFARTRDWIKAHPIKLWSPSPTPNPMPG